MIFNTQKNSSMLPRIRKLHYGFTLTELLIVLFIASIVAAAGYPSYQSYVLEQRRVDAIQSLQDAQIKITEHLLYNDNLPEIQSSLEGLRITTRSKAGFYDIQIDASSYNHETNSYKIVATPRGKQANDIECPEIWVSDKFKLPMPASCR